MEDGRWTMDDGRWRMEDRGWRMKDAGCNEMTMMISYLALSRHEGCCGRVSSEPESFLS